MSYLGNVGKFKRIDALSSTKQQLNLNHNLIKLNQDEVGQGIDERIAGLIVERGQFPDAIIRFNENHQFPRWEIGTENDLAPIRNQSRVINSSTILEPYYNYFVDTTIDQISLLLPNNPKIGDTLSISDINGMFDINSVTLINNGYRIAGLTEQFTLDIKHASIILTFISNDIGWAISPSYSLLGTMTGIEGVLNPEDVVQIINNNSTTIVNNLKSDLLNSIINEIKVDNIVENNRNFIASRFINYIVDATEAPIGVTLPLNPSIGDWFVVTDVNGKTDTNPITINYDNINLIRNLPNSYIINKKYSSVKFLFTDNGWSVLDYSVGGVGTLLTEEKNNSFQASPSKTYIVDTRVSPVNVTLPILPSNGDSFTIIDGYNAFEANPTTILYNDIDTIRHNNGNYEINVRHAILQFVFFNHNWYVFDYTNAVAVGSTNSNNTSSGLNFNVNNTNFVASKLMYHAVDTRNGPISVGLPLNPVNGDWFAIVDGYNNFSNSPVTIVANTNHTIRNHAGDYEIDIDQSVLQFVFFDNNWLVFDLSNFLSYSVNETTNVNNKLNIENKTTNFTAVPFKYYLIDTSDQAIDIVLPESVNNGDWFVLKDIKNNFINNPITVKFSNVPILNNSGDFEIDVNGANVKLVFFNNNWNVL